MRWSLHWLVPAIALFPLAGLAQPSARHDSYGKVVKLTVSEIDLQVTEAGHTTVRAYVIATYAKFGPAHVGDMARVRYYTDERGADIAETLTVATGNQPAAIPNPADAPEPAAVSSVRPDLAPATAPSSPETVASTQPDAGDRSPAAAASASGSSPWANLGRKPRIAVLDFDYAAVRSESAAIFGTNVDIGKGTSALLVADLVKDGSWTVIEPSAINSILAEQNLSNSGRIDSDTAAKIGKLLGVDAVVVGSVTRFGRDIETSGGSTGALGHARQRDRVTLEARIIDVNTGEIVGAAEGQGQATRSASGGSSDSALKSWESSVNMGSSDFPHSEIAEATGSAVQDLTASFAADVPRISPGPLAVEGLVAEVDGNNIIVNIGQSAGIHVGDEFDVVRVARVVSDPSTGSTMHKVSASVGKVKATSVENSSAVCLVVSGTDFKIGDKVTLVTK